MTVYICLLRGINVGGKRMKMSDLQDMFESIGIPNTKTLLASGNVVFQSDEKDASKLAQKIEDTIPDKFGFDSKIIMRTQQDLEAIIEKNPLHKEDYETKMLHVNFLRQAPSKEAVQNFEQAHNTEERVFVNGNEVFIYYPNGAGRSKLDIERSLNVIGTARNWNTVLKLQALAHEIAE